MTSQEPTYLPQGVNYLGFLSQQLADLVFSQTRVVRCYTG